MSRLTLISVLRKSQRKRQENATQISIDNLLQFIVFQHIGMPSLSRLFAGLHYRSAMRGRMMGTRMFTAIRMNCEEGSHKPCANGPNDANVKGAEKKNFFHLRDFHQLDKNIEILNVKIDIVQGSMKDLKTNVKELSKKVDHLLYFIICGAILKGGFDLLLDECNWNRSHKEN
ncbi:hypothetical protein EV426DRAFT_625364 [Tirmania nivea]|nr:hypothetical protein EV426DRAFT_625364 [Tirmania nivea]